MPIITTPHPTLRAKAALVTPEEFGTKKLHDIIQKMTFALRATVDGVGIAAPQINISKRIFLASEEALAIDNGLEPIDEAEKKKKRREWKYFVFINPEVIKISSKKIAATEGCLSVPKKYGTVTRAAKIRLRARDEQGKNFERWATQFFARLLQHELDHLDGKLFVDKAKKMVTINTQ